MNIGNLLRIPIIRILRAASHDICIGTMCEAITVIARNCFETFGMTTQLWTYTCAHTCP